MSFYRKEGMRKFFFALFGLGALALAAYVGVSIVVLGIEDIVNGAKANPTDAWRIAWGVVQVTPLAELAASAIIFVLGWILVGIFGNPFNNHRDRFGRLTYGPNGPQSFKSTGKWPGF